MFGFTHKLKERFLGNLSGDLIGGCMATVVALPLCLAFGVASGLGAEAGIYGAIACGIFAAVFGGTPGQCSGPTGPMTVVAAEILSANPGHQSLVFASVFGAGVFQIAMGNLRLGQLINYIPYPVISGFMTGIGSIILVIQLAPFLGIKGSGDVLVALQSLPDVLSNANLDACLIGAASLAIIYGLPRITKRIPSTLAALLVTTAVSHYLHLKIPTIGEIPHGLPVPSLPSLHWTDMHVVVQNALTLAVLGAIDTLLTSLVMDKVTQGRHNSDTELIGQGIGNMAAGLIGGLPGAGATMRSIVNIRSGGRTYLSGAVHGILLLVILVGLGNAATEIPLTCLAAILISVGISIMDWRVLRKIASIPRSDTIVMLVVLSLTIFVDLIVAVLAGFALASVLFVKQLSDSQAREVSKLETLEELTQLTEHIPESIRQYIYTYQFHGPLFFGEAKNLSAAVDGLQEAKYVILRFYNVPLIDQSGAYSLEDAVDRWEGRGIKVLFVGMQRHIRSILEATGVIHRIDIDNCFDEFEEALAAIVKFESDGARNQPTLQPDSYDTQGDNNRSENQTND